MSISASTSASEQDLPSRYRRLALAYTKMRADLKIAKNALHQAEVRNRDKSTQLNESDARARRLDAEVESLTFRNSQLEKRVSVLRNELDSCRDSKLATSSSFSRLSLFRTMPHSVSEHNIDPARSTLENELAAKIADNENLIEKVRDMEMAYRAEEDHRKSRIAALEAENALLQQQLSSATDDQEKKFAELVDSNRKLAEQCQLLQDECSKQRYAIKIWESKNSEIASELRSTEEARNSVETQGSFFWKFHQQKQHPSYVPVPRWRNVADVLNSLNALATEIRAIASNVRSYFSYSKTRIKLYPADGLTEQPSAEAAELCALIAAAAESCRVLGDRTETFLSKCHDNCRLVKKSDVQVVQRAISDFVDNFSRTNQHLKKCLVAESSRPWCDTKLAEENLIYGERLSEFSVSLKKLAATFLAYPVSPNSIRSEAQPDCIMLLIRTCSLSAEAFTKSCETKVAAEHALPIATKKLKAVNECIVAVLNSISRSLQKITSVCETNSNALRSFLRYALSSSDFVCHCITMSDSPALGPARVEAIDTTPAAVRFPTVAVKGRPVPSTSLTAHGMVSPVLFWSKMYPPVPRGYQFRIAAAHLPSLMRSTSDFFLVVRKATAFKYSALGVSSNLLKTPRLFENDAVPQALGGIFTKIEEVPFEFTAVDSVLPVQLSPLLLKKRLEIPAASTDDAELADREELFVQLTKEKEHWLAETKLLKLKLQYALDSKDVASYATAESNFIRQYYDNKLAERTRQLYASDGRNAFLKRELHNVEPMFNLLCRQNSELCNSLVEYKKTVSSLKAEMRILKEGYEMQIASVSDHMAQMNRTLTSQSDEIDKLRQTAPNRTS